MISFHTDFSALEAAPMTINGRRSCCSCHPLAMNAHLPGRVGTVSLLAEDMVFADILEAGTVKEIASGNGQGTRGTARVY